MQGLLRKRGRGVANMIGLSLISLFLAEGSQAAEACEPVPDMFCVSQRVDSLSREGDTKSAHELFVYRFHGKTFVDIAHGNPPVTQTEELMCIGGRTYKSFLVYSFAEDWRQGVAIFVDPDMSTVEFLNCLPDE